MSPVESSNPTIVGFENCNIAEEQDKELKITFMNIIKVLKEKMNEGLKEIYKKKKLKEWNEINKADQDLKIETESIKKIQTKGILEMKILRTQIGTSEATFNKRI